MSLVRITSYVFELAGYLRGILEEQKMIRKSQENLIQLLESKSEQEKKAERLLLCKEAAAILKVDPRTICNWRKSGLLKSEKIGGRNYYRESDVLSMRN